MELNDDIETIRQQLMKAEWPHGGRGTLDNTLAALDRLKAELTRLEGLVTSLTAVNRNRRVELDATQAEVERLQQKYNTMKGKLTTEVERLREEAKAHPYGPRWKDLEAENERLRRDNLILKGQLDANPFDHEHLRDLEAEVERLRERQDAALRTFDENERLRDALTSANDDYADSKAEVEGLRLEVERLREERDALPPHKLAGEEA